MNDRVELIAKNVVHCAYLVHKKLGPGLLERIYEVCLCYELEKLGYNVKRQVEIPITYDDITFNEGFRLDVLVNDEILIEIKAVEKINPVWKAQVITYLKLTDLGVGFLINFNVPLIKEGITRLINKTHFRQL